MTVADRKIKRIWWCNKKTKEIRTETRRAYSSSKNRYCRESDRLEDKAMMTNANRINNEALVNVAGGDYWDGDTYWTDAWATVASGYLALRSYPDYDDSNEILAISNGEGFEVDTDTWCGVYVWARARGCEGWVNSEYCTW